NVSITLNSLGYAPSGQPPGTESCLGAQADVAHQVVHELRTRDYSVDAGSPAGFEQVVLAGHSIGAEIAEIEAYSWADIDGLAEMSYSDQYPSQLAITTGVDAYSRCQTAPEKANGGSGPRGYVFFDPTQEGAEH